MIKEVHIFTDGAARGNPGPAAAAYHIQLPDGTPLHQSSRFLGETTNNVAEYEALLLAHTWLHDHRHQFPQARLHFFLDSELIVRQLTGQYKVKSPHLIPYFQKIKNLSRAFGTRVSYQHVKRHHNTQADLLANQALDAHPSHGK